MTGSRAPSPLNFPPFFGPENAVSPCQRRHSWAYGRSPRGRAALSSEQQRKQSCWHLSCLRCYRPSDLGVDGELRLRLRFRIPVESGSPPCQRPDNVALVAPLELYHNYSENSSLKKRRGEGHKPDSVFEGHLSMRPTRRPGVPTKDFVGCPHRAGHPQMPAYLALLRLGFAVPEGLAASAVRSYRTFSPLPVLLRSRRRSGLCGTFQGSLPLGLRPAACPMESGLSSDEIVTKSPAALYPSPDRQSNSQTVKSQTVRLKTH